MQNLEKLPPGQLSPFARNARTHSKRQIKQIARSIEMFGFTNPVLIDADNRILAGHGRVAAAKLLALPEVPCLRLTHLTEAQVRAYVIADNALAEKSGWDRDIRALELQGLIELGFDVTVTGYEIGEIDLMLAAHEAKQRDDNDIPVEPKNGPSVTLPGDVWRLGGHRLVCGDARDTQAYAKLMGDERAQLVFTDP